MITIIMSIGFSVDYSAHITYGYVCSTQQTPREKIREALGALGWPLTQGGSDIDNFGRCCTGGCACLYDRDIL
jgi:hypothetical protein